MNSESAGNAGSSAATSTTPPQPPQRLDPSTGLPQSELEQGGKGPDGKPLPEPRYITAEGEKARAAMKRITTDLAELVKGGVDLDLKGLLSQHPWVTMGAAAAAGFLAASAVTPSRDQSLVERLKSLMPESSEPTIAAAGAAPAPEAAQYARKSGATASVLSHLVDAFKTAVVSTVTSAISAKVATTPDAPRTEHQGAGNGQPA
jgi:hypothetical protein